MIVEMIGSAAAYEQLAEECSELAKVALKCARIIRGENPTPVPMEEAEKNLIEEYTDVTLVASILKLHPDEEIAGQKLRRWHNRLKEAQNARKV